MSAAAVKVVWQVWSTIPTREFDAGDVFSSYEEQAAAELARELNGQRLVPQFYVARSLVIAGRAV